MPVNLVLEKTNQEEEKDKEKKNFIEKVNFLLIKLSGVPIKEKLFFVQHLGIMLRAGISLAISLKTLSEQTENKFFRLILVDVSKNVERGVSFTESLRPHRKVFGDLFISMVEAGEISGKLEEVLHQIFIQLKKQHELISKVKGALTYPIVVVTAMGGIGIFMMIYVVPKITDMLKSFNAEMPLATRILIAVSDALVQHGILALVILIVVCAAIYKILHTYKGKFVFHSILLKLPIFSDIIKKINLAKFARTISSLLKTDIAIIKSFQITANVLGNLHYRKAMDEMAEKIKKGGQINEVISAYPKLFPPTVRQMIAVGEQTGELDTILEELASFYEEEVDQIMTNLPAIIEPVLILLLGCGIGGMAIAIIMPMYSLTSAV